MSRHLQLRRGVVTEVVAHDEQHVLRARELVRGLGVGVQREQALEEAEPVAVSS